MSEHKYGAGQLVDMRGQRGANIAQGPYSIVRRLPKESRENLYRLRSTGDGRERVAAECDLFLHTEAAL